MKKSKAETVIRHIWREDLSPGGSFIDRRRCTEVFVDGEWISILDLDVEEFEFRPFAGIEWPGVKKEGEE